MDGYVEREPRNCKICGRVFTYTGESEICMVCRKRDDDVFKRVKDFLWDHPNSSAQTVSIELNVPISKIRQYIREERVEVVGLRADKTYCQKCFAIIPAGNTYCAQCQKEVDKRTTTNVNRQSFNDRQSDQTKGKPGITFK